MSGSPSLDAAAWRRVLEDLAAQLDPTQPVQLIVIGGAAMALGYDARRTTRDVDALIDPADLDRILEAAAITAERFGLPRDWLNERAKQAGYVVDPVLAGQVLLALPGLKVAAPPIEQLAAMKLAAIRGQTDVDDARLLLSILRRAGLDAEAVWAVVGGRVPAAERDKARYNLLRVWEMFDEPA
jgi:predicted nucleotidyltransferase